MANMIILVEQVGLLLLTILVVAASVLAVGCLTCIHAMPVVSCESAWYLPLRH